MQFRRLLVVVLCFTSLAGATIAPADPSALGSRTPVILIHGWNADSSSFNALLKQAGGEAELNRRFKFYRFSYDWSRSIGTSAATLADDLGSLAELNDRPVMLVGHSMGGLVARSYLESLQPDWQALRRVALLLTLGSPHHGSAAANSEWLTGDSKYALLTKLMPLGLMDLLDRIPMLNAVKTEGGHDLGWDNYDGTMPSDLWAGANRYLQDLNQRLLHHPQRDELLARYRFHAGYLETVPPLTTIGLTRQVREGRHYEAGCALLAHAFRGADGQTVERWALNDGIVPLPSACLLRPGDPVFSRVDGKLQLSLQTIEQRSLRPGIVTAILPGVDHSGLAQDPKAVAAIFTDLLAAEVDQLSVELGGRPALSQPRQPTPLPLAGLQAGDQVLAAPRSDRLLVKRDDALLLVSPESAEVVGRSSAEGTWQVAPGADYAISPDGLLVGLTQPGAVLLGTPPSTVLWSPTGGAAAWQTAAGQTRLATVDQLATATSADPESRPVAWTNDGQWLLTSPSPGLLGAAFRDDGQAAALLVDRSQGAVGQVLGLDGTTRATWTIAPDVEQPTRSLAVFETASGAPVWLSDRADQPVWAQGGTQLAWIDGDEHNHLGLRTGSETRLAALLDGPAVWLGVGPDGVAYGVTAGDQPAVVFVDPVKAKLFIAGILPDKPAGTPTFSDTGRYLAVPLVGRQVAVVDLGTREVQTIAGSRPIWLPAPPTLRWPVIRTPLP